MEIHNTKEDLVLAEVNSVYNTLKTENKQVKICTCNQCRQDAACYVLNRIEPHYVVSHRGVARVNQDSSHQSRADLTALVYEGIKRVSHNQRPYFDHDKSKEADLPDGPAFHIPTIMGQVYNGLNFSPILTDINVELLQNGKMAPMKDSNWQNPYSLIPSTSGVFTFWPKPIVAEKADVHKNFEFCIKISSPNFTELNHAFSIPVKSELTDPKFSLSRTYKLPDLYLFPPGEEKDQLIINE